MRTNGTLTFLLADHLGSTSLAVTANGALASEQRYTAFGQTRYAMGDLPTSYEYTGQRNEELIGLYFYRARWYDPGLGRFVQPDTLIPGAGLPSSFDRYAYVHNNPLRYADPGGHWLETALDIAGIVYDIHDISSNGLNWVNGVSLVVDVAFTIVPVATGGGLIVRALAHADDAVDAARAVNAAVNTAQAANQAANAAQAANRGSDAARAASEAGELSSIGAAASHGDDAVTVRHYTDAAHRQLISQSGVLYRNTYVTLPSEIPSRAGHLQIERLLGIDPGRGANYIDFDVPRSRLRIPDNGPLTSGRRWQRQLTEATRIDPSRWRRPPGRPIEW